MKNKPVLYYRTMEQIAEYRKLTVSQKLRWLEEQMEFYHKTMPARAKKIRDAINNGKL